MFQRRVEGGTLNFTRGWADYRNGFGDQGNETTELWLGNEHVYQLVTGYGFAEGFFEGTAYDSASCHGVVNGSAWMMKKMVTHCGLPRSSQWVVRKWT